MASSGVHGNVRASNVASRSYMVRELKYIVACDAATLDNFWHLPLYGVRPLGKTSVISSDCVKAVIAPNFFIKCSAVSVIVC